MEVIPSADAVCGLVRYDAARPDTRPPPPNDVASFTPHHPFPCETLIRLEEQGAGGELYRILTPTVQKLDVQLETRDTFPTLTVNCVTTGAFVTRSVRLERPSWLQHRRGYRFYNKPIIWLVHGENEAFRAP